jgi:hypothetical protein
VEVCYGSGIPEKMMLIISEVTYIENFSICVGVRCTKAKGYIFKSKGFSYHSFSVLLGLKRRSVLVHSLGLKFENKRQDVTSLISVASAVVKSRRGVGMYIPSSSKENYQH